MVSSRHEPTGRERLGGRSLRREPAGVGRPRPKGADRGSAGLLSQRSGQGAMAVCGENVDRFW